MFRTLSSRKLSKRSSGKQKRGLLDGAFDDLDTAFEKFDEIFGGGFEDDMEETSLRLTVARPKYEYSVLDHLDTTTGKEEFQEKLNELGAEGWKLINWSPNSGLWVFVREQRRAKV